MESVGNPKTWVPYMYTKDCSQGFCSMYCPQWCRMTFPPPPSGNLAENGTKFSPLVITIISVLASCLLLVSYFAIISKYCRRKSSERRHNHDEELQDAAISSFHQPLNYTTIGGLDENFIMSIPVRKYKKDDVEGLVEGMDCSVCLGEFQETDHLRILPKCSHSFHIPCIDMWLKSHSTCPLCRASVTCTSNVSQLHPPITSSPLEIQSA
ncbi:unnamed protein product [Rhodiola kirilowii]